MTEPSLNRRLASAEAALKALKHPRQRKKIENTVIKSKVYGSRIQVRKDQETTEILIPPGRLRIKTITARMFATKTAIILGIGFASIFRIFTTAIQSGDIVLGIYSGFVALLIINFSGIPILFLRSIRVHLEPQKMYWTYEWLWYKSDSDPIFKKYISQLVYQPGYFNRTKLNNKETGPRFIAPQIVIFSRKKFEFSVEHLTEPEMEWIANEMNAWLRTNPS